MSYSGEHDVEFLEFLWVLLHSFALCEDSLFFLNLRQLSKNRTAPLGRGAGATRRHAVPLLFQPSNQHAPQSVAVPPRHRRDAWAGGTMPKGTLAERASRGLDTAAPPTRPGGGRAAGQVDTVCPSSPRPGTARGTLRGAGLPPATAPPTAPWGNQVNCSSSDSTKPARQKRNGQQGDLCKRPAGRGARTRRRGHSDSRIDTRPAPLLPASPVCPAAALAVRAGRQAGDRRLTQATNEAPTSHLEWRRSGGEQFGRKSGSWRTEAGTPEPGGQAFEIPPSAAKKGIPCSSELDQKSFNVH